MREYWIVDPTAETVVVQTLVDGRYADGDVLSATDMLTSQVLDGFALPLASIFPDTSATASGNMTQEDAQPSDEHE